MVFILLCLLIQQDYAGPQDADAGRSGLTVSVKSSLNNIGDFTNRLRLVNEYIRLSVLSNITGGELDFIEPSLMSKPFSAGRLKLKGAVREFYTSGSFSAGSTVFTESSGLTITDSFSGSSRYGAFLSTGRTWAFVPDSALWAFRTNSGTMSAGLLLKNMEMLRTDSLLVETNFIASAGTVPALSSSAWFAESPLLPEQYAANLAAELRFVFRLPASSYGIDRLMKIGTGRKAMRPLGEGFSTAVSAVGELSLPTYTERGGAFRGFLWLGTEAVSFKGFLEFNTDGYISPSGSRRPSAGSGGGRLFFGTGEIWKLDLSAEYNQWQAYPEVLLGRVIEKKEEFSVIAALSSDSFWFRLNGAYNWCFDRNGVFFDKGDASAGFRTESYDLITAAEVRVSGLNIFKVPEDQRLETDVEFRWNPDGFSAGTNFGLKAMLSPGSCLADEAKIKLNLKASVDAYSVSGRFSVNIYYNKDGDVLSDFIEKYTPEFSIGFESS